MTNPRNCISFFLVFSSVFLASCWDNFEERTYYTANVSSFVFDEHDTCPDIEDYVFLIDQYHGIAADSTSGTIYNPDSLPFGSVVNSLYPTVSFQSTNGNIYINDSLWEDEDSIDFTGPVVLKNTSYDGLYTRSYTIFVNVHQSDPDSMLLQSLGNLPAATERNQTFFVDGAFLNFTPVSTGGLALYVSDDTCRSWSVRNVSGLAGTVKVESMCRYGNVFYALTMDSLCFSSANGTDWTEVHPVLSSGEKVSLLSLFGGLKRKYITDNVPMALAGILTDAAGVVRFARSADGLTWTPGSEVPTQFPMKDYAWLKDTTVTGVEYLTVANGTDALGRMTNTLWSTENGSEWIMINDGTVSFRSLPARKNSTLFSYNGYLVSFGGESKDGSLHKDLWVSPDKGLTWSEADDVWALEGMSDGLSGSGVHVVHLLDAVNEKDREFIYLIGGKGSDGAGRGVWKAFQNQMIYARR